MSNEKKHVFNSVDCFILILILVLAVSFAVKGQLTGLFQRGDAPVRVYMEFTVEAPEMLKEGLLHEGDELRTGGGVLLGTLVSAELKTSADGSQQQLVCRAEGSAGIHENGYSFSAGVILTGGNVLPMQCGGYRFTASVMEIAML